MSLIACKECHNQISSGSRVCPHCGKQIGLSTGGGCLIIIVACVVFGAIHQTTRSVPDSSVSAPSQNTSSSSASAVAKYTALLGMKLNFTWASHIGEPMVANFTIQNNSDYPVKDLEITCRHYGSSGTAIDSNVRTVYQIVKPHTKKRFPEFNMGFIHSQVAKTACAVTDLEIVQ